jgi:hypothetical protein
LNLRPSGYEPDELPTALPRGKDYKHRLFCGDKQGLYYSESESSMTSSDS